MPAGIRFGRVAAVHPEALLGLWRSAPMFAVEGSSSIARRSFSSSRAASSRPRPERMCSSAGLRCLGSRSRVLRQVAERALPRTTAPAAASFSPAEDLEQAGLAGAVAAHQPDLVAGAHGEAGRREEPAADLDGEVSGLKHGYKLARPNRQPNLPLFVTIRLTVAEGKARPVAGSLDDRVHTLRRFVLTIVIGGFGLAIGLIALAPQAKAVTSAGRSKGSKNVAKLNQQALRSVVRRATAASWRSCTTSRTGPTCRSRRCRSTCRGRCSTWRTPASTSTAASICGRRCAPSSPTCRPATCCRAGRRSRSS